MVSMPSFEHFMASFVSSIRLQTMKKSGRLFFYNNTEKLKAELALCSVAKLPKLNTRCVANRVIFVAYTLIDNSAEPISAREFRQLL